MKDKLIRSVVRSRFRLTSRRKASGQIAESLGAYLELAERLDGEKGRRPIRVPRMVGVDEDMRDWSFFMVLEHNTIVNRSITGITRSLALGQDPSRASSIDPKKDVMPSADPGDEQIGAFRESVESHLETVAGLPGLRGTRTRRHPVFGLLDAHGWHCVFGFHLRIHLRQAKAVVAGL